MATGDQGPTAAAVARAVRLTGDDVRVVRGAEIPDGDADAEARDRALDAQVVARASPEQKLACSASTSARARWSRCSATA